MMRAINYENSQGTGFYLPRDSGDGDFIFVRRRGVRGAYVDYGSFGESGGRSAGGGDFGSGAIYGTDLAIDSDGVVERFKI
jgi:hypothetical protein